MSSPMEKLLESMLEDDDVIQCQISFSPGMVTQAGALKKGPIKGIYCLGTPSMATKDTPGDYKEGELVMVEQLFEADAVQCIMRFMEQETRIVTPAQFNH